MDKEWVYLSRVSKAYRKAAREFVTTVQASKGNPEKIQCPCIECLNLQHHHFEIVYCHLVEKGMDPTYTRWVFHGESPSILVEEGDIEMPDTYRMYRDAYLQEDVDEAAQERREAEFAQFVEEAEVPLYRGSNYSKMSATVILYNYKARHCVTDRAFTELLKIFQAFLPQENTLPHSLSATKKFLKAFDLGFEKIHACVNHCCLFRKDLKDMEACPKCSSSRWKVNNRTKEVYRGVPAKVLRYFPIIPRFRRMFRSIERAEELRWHYTNRSEDGLMRHPVDSLAWKRIDSKFPDFASDPRNLRLGLSSDGFNPFGDWSSRHSCWPVLLVTYNLPPSMCMASENLMLTLLIPGPKQPGNNIDIYLEPLIEDLMELWNGVNIYDAFSKSTFNLKAILMWTINDLPAYANLSGYSTKGKKACPVCAFETCSDWLPNCGKFSYMGSRRFLAPNHKFRFNKGWFNGKEEHRPKPRVLTGSEVLELVNTIPDHEGKAKKQTRKRKRNKAANEEEDNNGDEIEDDPLAAWKKKSIFFELPYWQVLLLRHNLDPMHIEKNSCESLIGTLLNMKGKTKDSLKARKDLKKMGIRKGLHPENDVVGSRNSKAPFVLSKDEKKRFCGRLAALRFPYGYSSNIGSRVSLQDCKILSLKSHDYHVLIQQVLPVLLRGLLKKGPRIAIFRLCAFLNEVCQKVVDVNKLEQLENEVAETLSMFERFFPPSFFDISLHLIIHLGREARIGGPVQFRWMFPFERHMRVLKRYTKNYSNPEGCMATKSLASETSKFCGGYMRQPTDIIAQGNTSTNVSREVEDETITDGKPIGQGKLKPFSSTMLGIAHLYVLENTPEVEPYREMHLHELQCSDRRLLKNETLLRKRHVESFSGWLERKVRGSDKSNIPDIVKWLGFGPRKDVNSYSGYAVNGHRFHTKYAKSSSQNSGVSVEADTMCRSKSGDTSQKSGRLWFYGVILDIILLDYWKFKVPIFNCHWASMKTGIRFEDGLTLVNLHQGQREFQNDPFILARQAKQVFYSRDEDASNWYVVLQAPPRGFYENQNVEENEYIPSSSLDVSQLNLEDEDYVRGDDEELFIHEELSDDEDYLRYIDEELSDDGDCDEEELSDNEDYIRYDEEFSDEED